MTITATTTCHPNGTCDHGTCCPWHCQDCQTTRKTDFDDGMSALYRAKDALASARNAFARLDGEDPAYWLDNECYSRWLDLRRMLIKIEDGEV
jgi:hypothetical protein